MVEQNGAPASPRPRVQSAARAIGILLAVARSQNGLSTKEISEAVGIGRQATYHLLHTLFATGVLTRNEQNRYLLGLKVATLTEGFARQLGPSEHLAPMVRALAQETGETAYAVGWWAAEVMVFTVAQGSNPVQVADVRQGQASDAHARASGKLLLAFATSHVREAYLAAHSLRRRTANTITTLAALERELAEIRQRVYAIDDEEFAIGLCCLALPLDDGYSPFALSVSAPSARFAEHRQEYLDAMRRVIAAGGRVRSEA